MDKKDILFPEKTVDSFSHRRYVGISSNDDCEYTIDTQYSMLREQLVRENFGRVVHKAYNLSFAGEKNKVYAAIEDFPRVFAAEDSLFTNPGYIFYSRKFLARLEIGESRTKGSSPKGKKVEFISLSLITYDKDFLENVPSILSGIGFRIIVDKDVEDDKVNISFISSGPNKLNFQTRSFTKLPLSNIEKNYRTSIIEQSRSLVNLSSESQHGLVVINGPVGTGKSYLIRSLLSEMKERYPVVCSPATRFLSEAGMLSEAISAYDKSTLVLEDVGEILSIEASAKYINERSNLINFAEGLLSLLSDVIIIVTFNHDIAKVDPAVLRPGRCLSHVEVGYLSYEQAQSLCPELKLEKGNYSLAQIYEMNRTKIALAPVSTKAIGF